MSTRFDTRPVNFFSTRPFDLFDESARERLIKLPNEVVM